MRIILIYFFVALSSFFSIVKASEKLSVGNEKSALAVIQNFYSNYLNSKKRSSVLNLNFCHKLKNLQLENKLVCQKRPDNEVCGWSADGDIFLDAQEIDPNLNYENSNFTIKEKSFNQIKVQFNVYPSFKKSDKSYIRSIIYLMAKEKYNWCVKDIIRHGNSLVNDIKKENSKL